MVTCWGSVKHFHRFILLFFPLAFFRSAAGKWGILMQPDELYDQQLRSCEGVLDSKYYIFIIVKGFIAVGKRVYSAVVLGEMLTYR